MTPQPFSPRSRQSSVSRRLMGAKSRRPRYGRSRDQPPRGLSEEQRHSAPLAIGSLVQTWIGHRCGPPHAGPCCAAACVPGPPGRRQPAISASRTASKRVCQFDIGSSAMRQRCNGARRGVWRPDARLLCRLADQLLDHCSLWHAILRRADAAVRAIVDNRHRVLALPFPPARRRVGARANTRCLQPVSSSTSRPPRLAGRGGRGSTGRARCEPSPSRRSADTMS